MTKPRVLSIAGSDSGGGAGIQADLKTIGALGGYGMTAITAVTAQNTLTVAGVHDLPPEFVALQLECVLQDIGVDAVKTGMLSNAQIIEAVAAQLQQHDVAHLVVDPVMIAKSGDALLREDARAALIDLLLPLASLLTPNLPEAEALAGMRVETEADMREAGARIHSRMQPQARVAGACHVLMKGGHTSGPDAVDWLFDGTHWQAFSAPRVDTRHTHGTGCTYAAAIATLLGRGLAMADAVDAAKKYVTNAIRHHLPLGSGHGPLDHFWNLPSHPR